MNGCYILVGREPVLEPDLEKWGGWFEQQDNRRVASTEIGGQSVSTIFLGIDHQWGEGPPLLFETMVFPDGDECERCSTWEEAELQHAAMVEHMKELQSAPEPQAQALTGDEASANEKEKIV